MNGLLYRSLDAFWKAHDFFQPKSYGKARFMRRHEMAKLLNKSNKGLCFSPHYRLDEEESCSGSSTFAITGVGKTTRKNMIDIMKCQGSMIVIDAVDEEPRSIYNLTSGLKHSQGFKVKPIRLDAPSNSYWFNHLRYCETAEQLKDVAWQLAERIKGSEPIWHTKAFELIYLLQSALKRWHDQDANNQFNVVWLLRNFGVQGEGIRDFMYKTIHPGNRNGSLDLWASYVSFTKLSSNTLQGIVTTAIAAMSLWQESSDNISVLTAKDNLELEKLREEKTVIYLIFDKARLEKYDTFINLFISTCMEMVARQKYKKGMLPLYLFLDEFGNLPPIRNFASLVSTVRAYKVSVNITAQSLSQLTEKYGKDQATTILDNLSSKLFLGGLNHETCKMISEMLGDKTIQEVVEEKTQDGKHRTVTKGVRLMPPDEIRMLSKGCGIGIFGGHRPIFFKKLKGYYEYPDLLEQSRIPPFQPAFDPPGEVKRVALASTEKWFEASPKPHESSLKDHIRYKNSQIRLTIPSLNLNPDRLPVQPEIPSPA